MEDTEILKYRRFALKLGELYEGRKAAYYFQWAPNFIEGCPTRELKQILMEEAEQVINIFLKELKSPPPLE